VKSSNRLDETALHVMLLPSVIVLCVFAYLPMLGVLIAFQDYRPILGFGRSRWVGLDNFRYIFRSPDFYRALKNTLTIASFKYVLGVLAPLIVALLVNEVRNNPFKRVFQTLIYLPHFLSWVILAGILIDILSPVSGAVNMLIKLFGGEPVFFLADNNWFQFTLISTHMWKETGWGTIVFLAALTGIDPSLYEAAVMDGASRARQTWHITIPGIATTVILIAALNLSNIMNAGFEQVFNLYSPRVYETGDIIDTFVYRIGIQQAQFSVATAVGLFKSVIFSALLIGSYRVAHKFAGYRIF
jgi:putative aldouronate transport system permease protein